MNDNCDGALAELYRYLDGELADEVRSRVEHHLRECSPCLETFDFEAELKRLIANRCRDTCPDELRSRIQAAIEGAE